MGLYKAEIWVVDSVAGMDHRWKYGQLLPWLKVISIINNNIRDGL